MMPDRYSRQIRFPGIGGNGQARLAEKSVAVVGMGALGSSHAEILARAGVGTLRLIDRDYIEMSNLQRQQLYTEKDALDHLPKVMAAAARLNETNSEVVVEPHLTDLNVTNALDLLKGTDVILDATDNFETRQLINDTAQYLNIPWIYGGATASYGLTYTFIPKESPCFNCVYNHLPVSGDTCDTVGIIAPIIQWVSAHQTTEALKILVGKRDKLRETLLYQDIWNNEQTAVRLKGLKRESCPSCGKQAVYPHLFGGNAAKTAVLCGRDTVQLRPNPGLYFDYSGVTHRLSQLGLPLESNDFLTNIRLGDYRLVLFKDGRCLVHGTSDPETALKVKREYIGG